MWKKIFVRFASEIGEQLHGTDVFGVKFLGRPDSQGANYYKT